MKGILLILTVCFISCSNPDPTTGINESDTAVSNQNIRIDSAKDRNEEEWDYRSQVAHIIRTAIDYAYAHKDKGSFEHSFEMITPDGVMNTGNHLSYGNLFDRSRKHLLIRTSIPSGMIMNVFVLEKDSFVNRLNYESDFYTRDTISDVNGDRYKDLLVYEYSSAGCCRRNVAQTFICLSSGSFTSSYGFMNPTFYPAEKIIRGVAYGHPGEVPLYKCRWNGLKTDTLEFIYHYRNQPGKFIRTSSRKYFPGKEDGKVLSNLPQEYSTIRDLDWFMSVQD